MSIARPALLPLLWLFGLLATAAPALAATDMAKLDGVSLRLVAERPGEDGRFRAALAVDLEPGWKTYWLDPGEAGIPPDLDFSGSTGVENAAAHFPAPHRFDDGFSKSIVYSEPLAVSIDGRAARGDGTLDVKITLGICRDICIPAAAELSASLGSATERPEAVAVAFAALPQQSTSTQGIVGARLDGDTLRVEVRPTASAGRNTDLFVSAPKGWSFGPPMGVDDSGEAAFVSLPVATKPRKSVAAEAFTIEAILTGPNGTWRASGVPVGREP